MRSTVSSRLGTSSRLPVAQTPECTRAARSSASPLRVARRSSMQRKRSIAGSRLTWPCARAARSNRASTLDSRRGRAPIATASTTAPGGPRSIGGALWYPQPIDLRGLKTGAQALVGHHDFRAFTPTETEHDAFGRTVLAARWQGEPGGLIEFDIVAESFLRHMVRGARWDQCSRRSAPQLVDLLQGAPRDRAGRTVSAAGLCLVAVAYTPDEVEHLSALATCSGI